jgi:hypothetical protein
MSDNPKLKKNGGDGTGLGNFLRSLDLKENLPKVLGVGMSIIKGDVSAVERFIKGNNEMTVKQQEYALKLLETEAIDEQEKTKRWESDAHSDSWLSKNVRPIIVLYLIFCTSVLIICDSIDNSFKVAEHWVTLLTSLLIVAVGGYFSLREFGKFASKKYK